MNEMPVRKSKKPSRRPGRRSRRIPVVSALTDAESATSVGSTPGGPSGDWDEMESPITGTASSGDPEGTITNPDEESEYPSSKYVHDDEPVTIWIPKWLRRFLLIEEKNIPTFFAIVIIIWLLKGEEQRAAVYWIAGIGIVAVTIIWRICRKPPERSK